jgi:hypothetical protein
VVGIVFAKLERSSVDLCFEASSTIEISAIALEEEVIFTVLQTWPGEPL